jgi:hypothetical protein
LRTAGSGLDGMQTVTATAYKKINNNGQCSADAGGEKKQASYVLDDTGPTVTGSRLARGQRRGLERLRRRHRMGGHRRRLRRRLRPEPGDRVRHRQHAPGGVTRTATATDRLGNSGSGSVTVKLDKDKPAVAGTASPAPDAEGWHNTDVTVSVTCSDALSGISGCTGGGTNVLSSEGAAQVVSASAVDNAGNTASTSVGPFNIDKTAPSLTGSVDGRQRRRERLVHERRHCRVGVR